MKRAIKHWIKLFFLRTGLIRWFPSYFPSLLTSYQPGSWGNSLRSSSLKLLVFELENVAGLTEEICKALRARGNELYQPKSHWEGTCGAALFFDTTVLKKALQSRSIADAIPLLLCIEAGQLNSISEALECEGEPPKNLGIIAFNVSQSPAESPSVHRGIRFFDLSTDFKENERPAFIATRIEELYLDLVRTKDNVLHLSSLASKVHPFARPAVLVSSELPSSEKVSFIIPTLNAGLEFRKTLQSIRCQRKYGENCSINIIDSGSRDGTVELAREFGAKIISLEKSSFNHGRTRDLVLSQVSTPFAVLTVQDAVLLDSETTVNLVRHFAHPRVAGVYTCALPVQGHDRFATFESYIHRTYLGPSAKLFSIPSLQEYESLSFTDRLQFTRFDNVCSSIRREVWEKFRFGKTQFGEDMAWAKRVQLAGFAIAFDPFARIIHSHMRPPEYTKKRSLIQGYCTAEILGAPPAHLAQYSAEEIKLCERQVERTVRSMSQQVRTEGRSISGHLVISTGDLRAILRRLHARVQFQRRIKYPEFQQYHYQYLMILGYLIYENNIEEMLAVEDFVLLSRKALATVHGNLWSDYISSVAFEINPLPIPLAEMLKTAGQGV